MPRLRRFSETVTSAQEGEIFVGLTAAGLLVYGGGMAIWSYRSAGPLQVTGPSITDWIVAVVAIAAFLGALWAASSTWRTLQVERRRDREFEENARRNQANMVAAWASEHQEGVFVSTSGNNEVIEVRLCLRNASTLPVTNVKVALLFRTEADLSAPLLPFADMRTEPVLPPTETSPLAKSVAAMWSVPTAELRGLNSTALNRLVIHLRFTDAAGVEWRRDTPGALRPVEEYAVGSFWCRDM